MLDGIVHGGISLDDVSPDVGRLLCYFRHRWLDFRVPEIEALAGQEVSPQWRLPVGGNVLSPFWYLTLPDLELAQCIASRSLLLKARRLLHCVFCCDVLSMYFRVLFRSGEKAVLLMR